MGSIQKRYRDNLGSREAKNRRNEASCQGKSFARRLPAFGQSDMLARGAFTHTFENIAKVSDRFYAEM